MLKLRENELLISEIQNHNVLWNKQHKKYKNKKLTSGAWSEISKRIGINKIVLKKRWKNLRDHYIKERKRFSIPVNMETHYSKWYHYKSLFFLENTLTLPNTSRTSLKQTAQKPISIGTESIVQTPSNNAQSDRTHFMVQTCFSSSSSTPSPPLQHDNNETNSKNKNIANTNNCSCWKRQSEGDDGRNEREMASTAYDATKNNNYGSDDDDDDMIFLKSMHQFLVDMMPLQKLKVKSQIQNIFVKELTGELVPCSYCPTFNFPHRTSYAHPGELLQQMPMQSPKSFLQPSTSHTQIPFYRYQT